MACAIFCRRRPAFHVSAKLMNLILLAGLLPLACSQSIPLQLSNIFKNTNEAEWDKNANWYSDKPYCSWFGISCYEDKDDSRFGKIKMINLSGNRIVGTISPDIWKLSDLQTLDLRDNPFVDINFNGIEEARSLDKLILSNTGVKSFYGLDAASFLKELHLTDCGLEGTIPEQIYELRSLEGFYGNYNKFTGSLSDKIGQLTQLQDLYLFDNDITGTLPNAIGDMKDLGSLTLSYNDLSGTLPADALNRLTELEFFAINRDYDDHKGGITGPLPSFDKLTKLTELYVQNNLITGKIPPDFLWNAPKEESVFVDISDNMLTGIIESTRLKDFEAMTLTASGNNFTGIDPNICENEGWNDGDVGYYGCEAIVCPVRTYSPEGRQTYYDACMPCSSSNVVGAYECEAANNTQRKILDKFYWDMDGTNWEVDQWYDEDHECDWNGIVCNYYDEVTEINLSSNGLSGNPGSDIFLLPELKVLDLSDNLIDFQFKGIKNAKKLSTLSLYGTGLSSLDDIGELAQTSVSELYMSDNDLDGSIPSDIYDFTNLQILMISFNKFSGTISKDIGKLSNLQILRAYGNVLTGSIPSEFGKLQRLNELILSENDLSGSIPLELNNMPELEEISIHQSTNTRGGLSGTLPDFVNCKKLNILHLASNSIGGPLPDDFLKFSKVLDDVIEVDLSDNEITGALPSDWDRFRYLDIDLTENKIVSISSGLCERWQWESGNVDYYGCNAILCDKGTFNVLGKQTNYDNVCKPCPSARYMGATQCGNIDSKDTRAILEALYISTNGQRWTNTAGWMTDSNVCNWYGVTCKGNDVVKITLNDNGLSGAPTNDIYDLPELEELDLRSNGISFNFKGVERASKLETLNLSSTQIKSLEGIGGAKMLATLNLMDSYISGSIPDELYRLTKLEHLYLDHNQISGRLSPDIENLINLEVLSLTGNQLSGQIPNHIGTLRKLRTLILSENNFGGTIPKEMNNLESLETLSLQREMGDERGIGLGGQLPSFNALLHLQKLDLGFNNLQGSIPVDFLNGVGDKSKAIEIDLTSNSLEGTVPSSLNQFNKLNIYLADNDFSGLAPGLCSMKNWMNGEVASYSCDAIMCAPGTYSEYGRYKDSDSKCEKCPATTLSAFWGSKSCLTEDMASTQGEQAILKMLYKSLGGDSWHNHDNWMSSEISICNWKGITCTPGGGASVQAIRLANNALAGDVPSAIFDLENLRDLNLSGNSIEMNLSKIGNAKKLQYLNLDYTGIQSIDGIESASSLMFLHVSNNRFKSFPSQVLSLNKLETLVLSSNAFGTNLADLSPLNENLTFFECDECGLTGSIPEWLNGLTKLEHLSLSGNKFVGPLPNLESMSSLNHLDLSDQIARGGGINGFLPSFSSLPSLSELNLYKNKLDGAIPDDFLLDVKSSFIRVDLRKNWIEGTIPPSLFARFDDLTLLLANNKITMIPEDICDNSKNFNWNGGDMADFGCKGLLCRPGSYNELGRETDNHKCVKCTEVGFTQFFGSTSCGSNTQKDILSILYSNLSGADWYKNDGWMENEDICQWYGIECVSGSVTTINLEENGLSGKVPVDLFDITTLVKIDLKGNEISFPFEGIEKLTQLKSLVLSDIGLSSIDGIGKLGDTLTELHLTDNSLSIFPEELYDLTNLKELYLNYNDIEDAFSSRIGSLTVLEHLFVFENKMNGSLPPEIGNLKNLKSLALGGNFFTGSIPQELNKLQNIEILAIQRSQTPASDKLKATGLSGTLPAFDKLPNIREIYLANQSLSGTIPDSFLGSVADTKKYILVDLTMNKIEGSLPFSLKKFDRMDIYLGGNEIENIDDSFCSLGSWMGGDVGKFGCDAILCPRGTYNLYGKQSRDDTKCMTCPFTYTAMFWGSTSCSADATDYDEREILAMFYDKTGGSGWTQTNNWKEDSVSICDWYGVHCASEDDPKAAKVVKQIQLPSNKLTGTVPPQIFGLKHLEMLNLGDNHIDFEFHGIGAALMLNEIYLDSTDISDIDGIGYANNLKSLHLQHNNFGDSTIPKSLFDLTKLKHLYVSDSNFGGQLSSEIGQLTNLEDFYCHGNNLIGTIPSEIGKMTALEVLVLSENRFIGSIPNEIDNLINLQSLYIDSFTRRNAGLSGPLPSFSSMTDLHEVYLGSNSLTGSIPEDFLSGLTNKEQKVTIGLKSNRMEGTLPASLSSLGMLDIDISDNFVTGIAGELCLMEKWNKGGVDEFKCNAILCPVGHFNQFGYQLNQRTPCKKCGGEVESSYLGATVCQSEVKKREREILEAFYHACGGDEWKNKKNWLKVDVDICHWYGISCRHGGTVDSILLGSNNVVGTPPREIFELTGLKWLWLYSNPIKFSFHGIDQAERLTSLLLDSTGLKSIEGIGNAYQLTDLDLRFNSLSGSFPNEISYLVNLESLSLTENYLTGTLPSLSRLHRLKSLRLGENMFSGTLPDFSSHTKLNTLDLSGNILTGEIPETLLSSVGSSSKEMFIDLSSNRLKGKVPGSFDRFDKMTLLLRDNFISSIDPGLCDNNSWNNGDVGLFECDGLLCPPGTYAAAKGRQSNDGAQCIDCKEAKFYGQSRCIDLARAYSNSGAVRYYSAGLIISAILVLIVI